MNKKQSTKSKNNSTECVKDYWKSEMINQEYQSHFGHLIFNCLLLQLEHMRDYQIWL